MTKFRTNYNETYPISDTGAKISLVANTEQTFTVPGPTTQKYRARFSYAATSEVWVKINGTPTPPIANTAVATYMEEFRPENIYVLGGDVIHVISTGTPQVGISFLSLE